ncbi:Response regulator PleD [Marinomonas aquimarina]|uniref:Response regulator PleD n=1 Tax=Marinomonas aquimarina TaxID=295068 RepID=A0A1A8T8I5_9GAMM|nr:response regulator [Marinomonas aquimarina]SBS28695.1 Response regulator PleD [Marinomonas aquimarina]
MSDGDQKTILLLDDSPANIKVLNSALKDHYRTKIATNGIKALEIASRDPQPDLILLDIMMPEMNGFEVCSRLKERPETNAIPVIFLTGKTSDEDREKGLSLGAVGFLDKPINVSLVVECLQEQLGTKT